MAREQELQRRDEEIAWTRRRPPLQGGWGPGWDTPEAHVEEGPLARALAERVAHVVRQRLEDAVREELADELRDRLAERVRERVSSALRGTPLRDTPAIADRITKELHARMREQRVARVIQERLNEGAHRRIVDQLCTAFAQAELDPERVIERVNKAVRERVPQALRDRLREELRDRVGYPIA